MSNTLIASYLGQGLLASRPATPTIDTGSIGFYYATDTGVLSIYANGAWSTAGGGSGAAYHQPLSTGTSSDADASLGFFFTPLENITVTSLGALLNSTTGGVYKFGIAPYNHSTKQITGAPVYTGTYTEAAGAANRKVAKLLSTPVNVAAGATYAVFCVRTDATSTTNGGANFASGANNSESLGLFVSGSNGIRLASLAPLTSDTWTELGSSNGVYCVSVGYNVTS